MKPVWTLGKRKSNYKLSRANLYFEPGEELIFISSLSTLKRVANLEKFNNLSSHNFTDKVGIYGDCHLFNSKEIGFSELDENKLSKAYEVLGDFDHKKFLEGAKFAFETIINAFNNNDKKTLKNLLTKEVFLAFENAIDEKKNNPNYQFYSIVVDEVTDVSVIDSLINITLKITSEQFKNNDESTISKKQDTWTFQKKINSNSPIWLLSST